jgi:hypothetical protein
MKYLGYISPYDYGNEKLESYRTGKEIDPDLLRDVLKYLKQGTLIWTWMESWFDDEGQFIGGATYYTDGEWVWPYYFVYFIEKYKDLKINKKFIEKIKKIKGVQKILTEKELIILEEEYHKSLKAKASGVPPQK